jgi:hypothetical protein
MLETARLGLLIRRDNAGHERAYGTGAGKALAQARDRGWTVVSMREDSAQVFLTAWRGCRSGQASSWSDSRRARSAASNENSLALTCSA